MGPEQAQGSGRRRRRSVEDDHRPHVRRTHRTSTTSWPLSPTASGSRYDRTGGNHLFNDITDDDRMDMVVTLVERGYLNRIFWSQDSIATWLGRSWDGFHALPGAEHWKITRIGDYIVPGLLERGLTDADIDQLLVGNIAGLWN